MGVFLIAEIASAHDRNWKKAVDLVWLAADAGFDCCKMQWWSDADKLADRRGVPDHYREIYHRYQIPETWIEALADECKRKGIAFMCTTYLPEDIPKVAPYVSRWKVASFEADDLAFVMAHSADKPLVISTGMMSIDEVESIVYSPNLYRHTTLPLHCVSAYPCPIDNAELDAGVAPPFVGYSDHTAHTLTGAVAVGAGAAIIEAHIKLADTDKDNPDYACALFPEEARQYVENVRLAERMMGSGEKKLQDVEKEMAKYRVKG
jgi:sialic acid synthase SpsE